VLRSQAYDPRWATHRPRAEAFADGSGIAGQGRAYTAASAPHRHHMTTQAAEPPADSGQRVTPLELFFDLVFAYEALRYRHSAPLDQAAAWRVHDRGSSPGRVDGRRITTARGLTPGVDWPEPAVSTVNVAPSAPCYVPQQRAPRSQLPGLQRIVVPASSFCCWSHA